MCLGADVLNKKSAKLLLRKENAIVTVYDDSGRPVEITISINAMIEWMQGKPLDQAAPSLTEHERHLLIETFKQRQ